MTAVLYSRPGCHLCEAMEEALSAAGCTAIRVVNIDDSAELSQRFGLSIPVAVVDQRYWFVGAVSRAALSSALARLYD